MSDRLFVVQTDAPCKYCGDRHEYVTNMCQLVVFVDRHTASWVSQTLEGSAVREIRDVPEGISYHLYMHKNGRRDAGLPGGVSAMPGG